MVSEEHIRRGLAELRLGPGSSVVVHGSLRSLGQVEGGAAAVAAAVIAAVGWDGLVMMPVYASSEDERGDLLPEPLASATVWTGAIPAAFAARPDVLLTRHPLYAFAYYGRDAAILARAHERLIFPYGEDQPLHCLMRRRGFILQIGVDDRTNTSIHVAEELADPPYLREKKSQSGLTVEAYFRLGVQARRAALTSHRAGPRRDFLKLTPFIEQAGVRRCTHVGHAHVALTEFAGLCRLVVNVLGRTPRQMVVPV